MEEVPVSIDISIPFLGPLAKWQKFSHISAGSYSQRGYGLSMVKAFHLHIIGNQLDITRRLLLLTALRSPVVIVNLFILIVYDTELAYCVALKMLVSVLGP
jgi:hypothetical protein